MEASERAQRAGQGQEEESEIFEVGLLGCRSRVFPDAFALP